MRVLTYVALLTLGLVATGCITAHTIDVARGCPVTEPATDPGIVTPVTTYKRPPDPGYYLLVPFALAADVVASPYEITAKAINPDWTFFP